LKKLGEKARSRTGGGRKKRTAKSIMPRIRRTKSRDTDGDGVKDWNEILSFYLPADASSTPEQSVADRAKKLDTERRRRTEGFGKVHKEKKARKRR
jgi:hypothetical protein